MASDREELYVLRVQDRSLADRLQKILRDESTSQQEAPRMSIDWDEYQVETGNVRQGTFTVGEQTYSLLLQDLPTIVEAYKTYDDINLVKIEDVGQVLLVSDPTSPAAEGREARHGVTPPMRDARRRHFRKQPELDTSLVRQVEGDLLTIVSGSAPEGVEYIDVEEEFVVDAEGNGSWKLATSKKPPQETNGTGEAGVPEGTPELSGGPTPGKQAPKRAKKPKKTPTPAPDVSLSREDI